MSYASTILADTPQAYYRLNDTSGIVAHDLTTHHYDATLSGNVTLGQTGALSNDSDRAILFDPFASLNFPWAMNITSWAAITLEFWINLSASSGGWNFITTTYDGVTTLTYVDGIVAVAGTSASIEIEQSFNFAGSLQSATFDEVASYNYALSPLQVRTHFLANPSQAFKRVPLLPTLLPFSFRGGGTVYPINPPSFPYLMNGVMFDTQPYLCTAPALLGSLVPAGSTFVLFFANPSSITQTLLTNGSQGIMTFADHTGQPVSCLVQIASTLTNTMFTVSITTLANSAPILL